jgi:transposase
MLATPEKPTSTPIPVQLSESEFNEFIWPHLSLPKRGPKCKLGYHRVFNLILWVLYTGMQWKCLPVCRGCQRRRARRHLQRRHRHRYRPDLCRPGVGTKPLLPYLTRRSWRSWTGFYRCR